MLLDLVDVGLKLPIECDSLIAEYQFVEILPLVALYFQSRTDIIGHELIVEDCNLRK